MPLHENTIRISKICQEFKKLSRKNKDQKATLVITEKRRQEIRTLLCRINFRHKVNIALDESVSIENWIQDMKSGFISSTKNKQQHSKNRKTKESKSSPTDVAL